MSQRTVRSVFLLLLTLALARYIAVAFFVHPFADDFSYAVAGMRTELLPRLWDEYNLWNGRWFSNVLVLRGPLVWGMAKGLAFYRFSSVLMIILTWSGAFALIRAIAPRTDRWMAGSGGALFLAVYLHVMPDLSEGIYWYTGAVSYQLPGALTLLLMASWVRGLSHVHVPIGTTRVVLNAFLALIIAGCSELHMVFMVMLHAAILAFFYHRSGRMERSVLIVLGVAVFAAIVMTAAPGNAGRGGQFPHRHELLRTFGWGAAQTARFLATWIFSPALMLLSVLFLASGEWLRERIPALVRPLPIGSWTALALVIGPVFVAMALPYWATGLLGQHRTVNASLLLFLPLWFLALAVWDQRIHRATGRKVQVVGAPFKALVVLLFPVVLLFTGNGGRTSLDLVDGTLSRFDRELKARYSLLEEARDKGRPDVVVPALRSIPRSLRYLDASTDPDQWINRSLAYYFCADTLSITVADRP